LTGTYFIDKYIV